MLSMRSNLYLMRLTESLYNYCNGGCYYKQFHKKSPQVTLFQLWLTFGVILTAHIEMKTS